MLLASHLHSRSQRKTIDVLTTTCKMPTRNRLIPGIVIGTMRVLMIQSPRSMHPQTKRSMTTKSRILRVV